MGALGIIDSEFAPNSAISVNAEFLRSSLPTLIDLLMKLSDHLRPENNCPHTCFQMSGTSSHQPTGTEPVGIFTRDQYDMDSVMETSAAMDPDNARTLVDLMPVNHSTPRTTHLSTSISDTVDSFEDQQKEEFPRALPSLRPWSTNGSESINKSNLVMGSPANSTISTPTKSTKHQTKYSMRTPSKTADQRTARSPSSTPKSTKLQTKFSMRTPSKAADQRTARSPSLTPESTKHQTKYSMRTPSKAMDQRTARSPSSTPKSNKHQTKTHSTKSNARTPSKAADRQTSNLTPTKSTKTKSKAVHEGACTSIKKPSEQVTPKTSIFAHACV